MLHLQSIDGCSTPIEAAGLSSRAAGLPKVLHTDGECGAEDGRVFRSCASSPRLLAFQNLGPLPQYFAVLKENSQNWYSQLAVSL
jgi:hypothetical protein